MNFMRTQKYKQVVKNFDCQGTETKQRKCDYEKTQI